MIANTEQRAVFEEVPISGTVSSPRVTQLSPEVPGLVQEVLVDAGDRVEAGAPVVRLDGTLAGLALEAAEAATAQASEELADARRRLADAERLVQSRGIAETEVELSITTDRPMIPGAVIVDDDGVDETLAEFARRRLGAASGRATAIELGVRERDALVAHLPFEPTRAQHGAIETLRADLAQGAEQVEQQGYGRDTVPVAGICVSSLHLAFRPWPGCGRAGRWRAGRRSPPT